MMLSGINRCFLNHTSNSDISIYCLQRFVYGIESNNNNKNDPVIDDFQHCTANITASMMLDRIKCHNYTRTFAGVSRRFWLLLVCLSHNDAYNG